MLSVIGVFLKSNGSVAPLANQPANVCPVFVGSSTGFATFSFSKTSTDLIVFPSSSLKDTV